MSEYIDNLIYDRVQADLDNATAKGCIAYTDLIRVETAVAWCSKMLNKYGYKNSIYKRCRMNWKDREPRYESEMERIRQNIIELRAVYFTPESTPITPQRIAYTSIYQANAIEKILYDLGKLVENCFPGQQHFAFRLGSQALGNRSEI
ncbi:hypothetical protein SAMN05443270_1061 [Lacrimispora sphenoides]|uniref:hypothetical protein n=1 Tax=Lacrimispora sphenoides TaxID=29370 RepID=UPI0008BB6F31|nr:hypothetical protein [Lacrimispora sphenoides]SET70947.1 hypothetical protein SAMN05443270_1061 [Lacrimispora sphenoides]